MELELRQDYLSCWDKPYHSCINREETAEMIVPDACPDILHMLDGEGTLLLQGRELTQGSLALSGCIRVGILYEAEDVRGLCAMENVLPFSLTVENSAFSAQGKLLVQPCVHKVDIHILNPRKVLIKVNFSLDICVLQPQRLAICAEAPQVENCHLRQKMEEHTSYMIVAAQEKSFNYSDVLSLPAGSPDLAELLRVRASCAAQDSKVIGNKLLFKGEARVEILYRSSDGRLCNAAFPLPFSQMMELSEGCEEGIPSLHLLLCDLSCKPTDAEGRTLSLELELVAQAVIRATQRVSLLRDVYSTTHHCVEKCKRYPITRHMDHGSAAESLRERLESEGLVETVLDVQLRLLPLTESRTGDSLTLESALAAFVLVRLSDGRVEALQRNLRVAHAIPAAKAWHYDCEVRLARQATALPSGNGVELAFTLDFLWSAQANSEIEGVDSLTIEPREVSTEPAPALLIRSVREGETLWDLAKRYATTEAEIAEANVLSTMELFVGQMLLIPR